ncbi:serine hydroxymethyltransferase [Ignicoccus hospitalis]|uniref:Serine hydroxymethyltransferase n=1 Tax=Ignicoccus hospitalis (strain KIN4/I / DSM 18386 / JCM 14125) TaxID=453591 RepID=A8ABG6_IGNH4|nr:serine hydroxymethyltransferase [Ignicoccus hospitalis]ABU82268.1 serine hydroxymethyltransferase [Ignicoccus hospitalis KIN4/I]HIH90813.1 serine hydroxymethyltransferase [Desulfurococcaceae archaeon]
MHETLKKIIEIVEAHDEWRHQTINLIASENVMSPLAESLYLNDMMHRYAEGKPFKRYYQGTKYIDEIEVLATELMKKLFNSEYAEVRPVSGTTANGTVFYVLGQEKKKAIIPPVQAGSHVSHTKFGILGALCIEQVEMPYDEENLNIDVDKAVKMIEEVEPAFVVLGGSMYPFPHPVKEIAEAAHSVGAKVVYDAAHVLGLIAGKALENPLSEGADVMTASTHKTFPGPQGGVILTNDKDVYKKVSRTVFPVFVSNHHAHRLPSLAVTALEMLEFGEQYASQVVSNAKALAEELHALGVKVLGERLGFTRTHQVVIDVREFGGGSEIAKKLEEANIIVNKNLLPWDPPDAIANPSGIRMGVQEMTRFGMKEGEMKEVARLIKRVMDGEDPKKVKEDVVELRKQFVEVKYGYKLSDLKEAEERFKKYLKLALEL